MQDARRNMTQDTGNVFDRLTFLIISINIKKKNRGKVMPQTLFSASH